MSSSIPKIEEIVLDKGDSGLGFNIRGGVDNTHLENDPGIFVTTIKMNGAAAKDGRLQPGDKILEIDGHDLREVRHSKAVSYFHDAGKIVTLLVERGAEKRILNQFDHLQDQEPSTLVPEPDPVTVSAQRRAGGFFSWPYTWPLLIVGGSAAALLFFLYLRRRRQ